jgi:hypothetical protein
MTTTTGPYTENGSTKVFSFTFEVQDAADLTVTLTTPSGVDVIQTLGTDYSVSGIGRPIGGQILMVAAPPVGSQLLISLGRVEPAADEALQISDLFKEYRPGDAPPLFLVSGGDATVNVDGAVMRFTGQGSVYGRASVPLEPSDTYIFRVAYRRNADSGDPANDGISAGLDWYNGAGVRIQSQTLHSNNNLLVISGRVEFTTSIARPGVADISVYAPQGARYAVPWFRTYGTGHQTDCEICGLIRAPNPAPLVVEATDIVIPPDFQWPAGTIPTGTTRAKNA